MAASAGRRNALREISSVMISGTVYNLPNVSFPPTPTSPEEEVIRQLGRKKALKDEDYDESVLRLLRTPVKTPKKPQSPRKYTSPGKRTPSKYGSLPTRCSPRKRLNLGQDDFDETSAMADMSISSPQVKKLKLDVSISGDLEKSLLALNHPQLVDLLAATARASPDARQVIETLVPRPDLKYLETRLSYLQKNVGKALPRNVWGSQNDSYCFLRVKLHIDAFVKECQEHSRRLVDSQQWSTVLEFTQMAWRYAKCLPDFEDVANNKLKTQCLKQLASNLVTVIRKTKQEKQVIEEIIERIKEMEPDILIDNCIKLVNRHLQQLK